MTTATPITMHRTNWKNIASGPILVTLTPHDGSVYFVVASSTAFLADVVGHSVLSGETISMELLTGEYLQMRGNGRVTVTDSPVA